MEFPYESFSRFSDPLQEVAVVAKWPKESLSDASSAVSQRAFLLFLSMTVVVLEENEKEQVNESVKVGRNLKRFVKMETENGQEVIQNILKIMFRS